MTVVGSKRDESPMHWEMSEWTPPELPRMVFSNWFPWAQRSNVPDCHLPGVYLLARFTCSPTLAQAADPLSQNVVVIGQTARSLRSRWNQFHGAAFGGGSGAHSEGHRYRAKGYPRAMEELYVAAMPSSPLQWRDLDSITDPRVAEYKKYLESRASAKDKGPVNGAWIRYVERKLILDYVLKWRKLPECNAE